IGPPNLRCVGMDSSRSGFAVSTRRRLRLMRQTFATEVNSWPARMDAVENGFALEFLNYNAD
ncbi:MAG: hypothetical protein ACM3SP_19790, partial [Chloroflexota bacterium]